MYKDFPYKINKIEYLKQFEMNPLQLLYQSTPQIEHALGYTFKDPNLLATAFIHSSYINENKEVAVHNERLEFLGDSVLGMLIADLLFRRFPDKPEGELSSLRSRLVEAPSCMAYLDKLGVETYLCLGKGERQANTRGRQSILADLFEAIVGAIYLDGGLEAVRSFLSDKLSGEIEQKIAAPTENWKALYQDLCQKQFQVTPKYTITSTSGPEHNKIFEVAVTVHGETQGTGQGHSKKEAEQLAALDALHQHFPHFRNPACQ